MNMPLLLDIMVGAIVLLFFINGMRHGFVRALCSFLALFVALFGAIYLSKVLTPTVANYMSPYVLPSIEKKLDVLPPSQTVPDPAYLDATALLQTLNLPQNWEQMIEKISTSQTPIPKPDSVQTTTQWLALNVLKIITSAAIFLFSFLLILLLWGILSRSLDLVSRLPVLNFFNRILGGLFGLLKALLFLFLLRWLLCDLWGIIPQDLLAKSYSYQYISTVLSMLPLDRFFLLS